MSFVAVLLHLVLDLPDGKMKNFIDFLPMPDRPDRVDLEKLIRLAPRFAYDTSWAGLVFTSLVVWGVVSQFHDLRERFQWSISSAAATAFALLTTFSQLAVLPVAGCSLNFLLTGTDGLLCHAHHELWETWYYFPFLVAGFLCMLLDVTIRFLFMYVTVSDWLATSTG